MHAGLGRCAPTMEEWCEIIRRSDDPLLFETDETSVIKAIHRKVQQAKMGGEVVPGQ